MKSLDQVVSVSSTIDQRRDKGEDERIGAGLIYGVWEGHAYYEPLG